MPIETNSQKIYPYPDDSLHYLDFAAYPMWINQLYVMQTESVVAQELAQRLSRNIPSSAGISTRLRRIQQYLHNETYHMQHADRIQMYGYVGFEAIPYPVDLVKDAYDTIEVACRAHQLFDIIPQLHEDLEQERCVGSKNGSLEKCFNDREKLPQFRGKSPMQCAEEASAAAFLSVHVAGIPEDNIVLLGSPAHIALFIRPINRWPGCIFDKKMLYFPKDMKAFGKTPQEIKENYISRFGRLWFIVNSGQYLNFQDGTATLPNNRSASIIEELNCFFSYNAK